MSFPRLMHRLRTAALALLLLAAGAAVVLLAIRTSAENPGANSGTPSNPAAAGAQQTPAPAQPAASPAKPGPFKPAASPAPLIVTAQGGEFRLSRSAVFQPDPSGQSGGGMRPVDPAPGAFERALRDGALPVMEPLSGGRPRLLTNRVTARLADSADPAALAAAAGAAGVERPDYAPGHAVFLARTNIEAPELARRLARLAGVIETEVQLARLHTKKAMPNDPLVPQQWHLKNTASPRTHLNAEPAWAYTASGGVRGAGVRIGIVDDGLQTAHPDLSPNTDTANDKDWNGNDNDPNPGPGDDHGTAVAGVAAACGNNSLGVSGVAPEATLVGLRLTSDYVTDSQEAEAMAWRNDIIQIKNNSWGPDDSPDNLEGPGSLTAAAFASAASSGRGGRGTIFVWSAGNGGDASDNSNYDGYANSIFTIAAGAADSSGARAYYSEPGANLVVCAPSSGAALGITTTDRAGSSGYNTASSASGGDYTDDFGGTSSAAPAISGVIALMLERNPSLGWRDVQEILIRTAFKPKPSDPGWAVNGAGLSFHHDFGAGLADAAAAVTMAATWTNLPPQQSAVSTQSSLSVSIPNNNATGVTRSFSFSGTSLRVEHATVRLSITHTARGNLEITLTSPSGMTSRLAEVRADSNDHYSNWTFSSVRHWGENSNGVWTLKIADRSDTGNTAGGTLTFAEVTLYGAPAAPANQRPSVASAALSAAGQVFSDQGLSVTSVSASDPEGDPVTLSYQWQRSTDGETYSNEPGAVSAHLPAGPALAGKLWRCVITPSDAGGSGAPFLTASVNALTRPPALAATGAAFSYQSGLVLRGSPALAPVRQAILNEFSQGPSGGAAEWVEILTLKSGSLAYWDLSDAQGNMLIFRNSSIWSNIPAGTLIIIYNGASKDPLLPPDDTDASDGTLVLSSSSSTWFQSGSAWPGYGNSGDAVILSDAASNIVHAIAYGSSSAASPNVGAVGSGQAVRFTGGNETASTQAANWQVVPSNVNQNTNPSLNGVTPGAANTSANAGFLASLRSGGGAEPALFRIPSGASLPPGLSLNATSGLLSGAVTAPGNYTVTIERANTLGESVSQTFTLQVLNPNTFAFWAAGYPALGTQSGRFHDPDGDGLANVLEHLLGSRPDQPGGPALQPFSAQPGQIKARHTRAASPASDISFDYQWSTDLVSWHSSGDTNSAGVRVVIASEVLADPAPPGTVLIETTATATSGAPARLFLRLRAW